MKKKILVSLGAAALLVSSLYASQPKSCGEENNSCAKKCMKEKKSHQKCGAMHKGNTKKFRSQKENPIAAIMQLDLSSEQKTKIEAIFQEKKNTAPKISTAFSKNSFNKDTYIKMKKEHRELRLQKEAEVVEKIYATLTPTQKERLKQELDK